MHELGLTRNIAAIVAEHAGEGPVKRVQVGARACVEKQALAFTRTCSAPPNSS